MCAATHNARRPYESLQTVTLGDAIAFADSFGCSLDALTGRWDYVGRYTDERQERLNADFLRIDERYRDQALGAISGIAAMCEERRAKSLTLVRGGESARPVLEPVSEEGKQRHE